MRAPILTTGFVSVSLAVAPSVGDTLAGEINQRHVAVADARNGRIRGMESRRCNYGVSWNRSSSTTLVGILALSTQSTTTGRQLCYLPSECCDNNEMAEFYLVTREARETAASEPR